MRTALVLYGQPRFAEICYHNFYKDLIENLNADVYFHTWWAPETVGSLYPCAVHAKHALKDEDLRVRDNILLDLQEMYKPVLWGWNWYSDFPSTTNFQYYSQYRAKRFVQVAIQNGFIVDGKVERKQYDMIIRSRFDLMCTQQITVDMEQLDNLWVPSCSPYTDIRVNDMFSISNYDIFDKITDAYMNINEYEQDGHGEMEWPLARQIQRYNIPVKKFMAIYDTFDILRSDTADKYR
jgi:hypothetical protein